MPTLQVKTIHIEKLKTLGCYDKWLANLKAQFSDDRTGNHATLEELTKYSNNREWKLFVSYSFIFKNTLEGYDFWRTIKES